MKEEIVELTGAIITEDGVLTSYSGDAKRIRIPDEVKRIEPRAFAGSGIEKVVLHGRIGNIESNAFSSCHALREVVIESGVVKISRDAFSDCPSLTLIHIPKTVLIMDDDALPTENKELVIIAESTSFATKYAVAHSLLHFNDEVAYKGYESKKEERAKKELLLKERKETLSYIELDIFGEKIRVSNRASVCYSVIEAYLTLDGELNDKISKCTIKNEDKLKPILNEYIEAAVARVNKLGAECTIKSFFELIKNEYHLVIDTFINTREDNVRDKVTLFVNALKTAEIKCLSDEYLIQEDALSSLDIERGEEIAENIISSGDCPEISVALSLKLYPYNATLIKYAVHSGVLCEGLISLAKLIGIDFFAGIDNTVEELLARRNLFGKDIDNLVRGTLDAFLPEFIWNRLLEYDISPKVSCLDCTPPTFDEVAKAIISTLNEIKATLEVDYIKALNAYESANSIPELEIALRLFEAANGYGDSADKIREIKDKIARQKKAEEEEALNNAYNLAVVALMNAVTIPELEAVRKLFRDLKDYKDSAKKLEEIKAKIRKINKTDENKKIRKKKIKKITIVASILTVIATVITSLVIWGVSPRLEFAENDDGGYTLVSCNKNKQEIEIPETYHGKPVTAIGQLAFSNCQTLKSVYIPDSVTSIGKWAFDSCYRLKDINYEGSEEQWKAISKGDYWNYSLPHGYKINFNYRSSDEPNNAPIHPPVETPSIDENGYEFELVGNEYKVTGYFGTATNIVIPSTYNGKAVTSIGYGAFRNCTSLTSITIPSGVTTIDTSAFHHCTSLTNVTIPDSVTSIGNYAFYDCTTLTTINYHGTSVQWGNITKGTGWDISTGSYTIIYNYGSTSGGTATDPSNFTFQLEGNEYKITDYTGTDTEIFIPSEYNGKPVTSIGSSAFEDCTSLTSITIPDSVTSIGNSAFRGCTSLTSVTIGNGVTNIGSFAFEDCEGLTSVTIGDSVTSIGGLAFAYCERLTSVTIGDSVTSIDNHAFAWCDRLTSIIVDINNPSYKDIDGNLYSKNGETLIQYAIGKEATSFVIPDSVTSIGNSSFYGCKSLTSVTIPDSVTSIGSYTFAYCDSLTSVTIPDSVTSISDYAFCNCTSLTSVTIPDSVTSIGVSAFCNCTSLTSITIPDSVTSIGDCAFWDCTSLTTINYYGTSVQWGNITKGTYWDSYTGAYTIKYNYGTTDPSNFTFELVANEYRITGYTGTDTEIVIPSEYNGKPITSIGSSAFYDCDSLTSITIPDSVTRIGNSAFESCDSLTSVTIPDSVTIIGDYAFDACTNLASITIPDSVTSIGEEAFNKCTSLTSVTIGDSVTSIGSYAFARCTSLTSVTIGDSVTSIGGDAFYYCTSLKSVTIPDSVTSIGLEAFSNCTSLTSVTIPNSVTSISDYAFSDCESLTSVTIPDSATSIGKGAFYDCTNLESIIIPDSVTSINDYAFRNCKRLTSVTIGDSVTGIGGGAFMGCKGLTSVTIPDSVTSIGDYALKDCTSLKSITIPDSVTSIGAYAFSTCTSLTTINYCGTSVQWSNITKGTYWDSNAGLYTTAGTYTFNLNYKDE